MSLIQDRQNRNFLDGSNGETIECAQKMKGGERNVEIFDRCVNFPTRRCKNGPDLFLVQS